MLLVGAGQLAQVLAQPALAMTRGTGTDTRDAVRPMAGPAVPCCMACPMTLSPSTAGRRQCHHHAHPRSRIDDMALLEALETPAWYVGDRITANHGESTGAFGVPVCLTHSWPVCTRRLGWILAANAPEKKDHGGNHATASPFLTQESSNKPRSRGGWPCRALR